MFVVLASANFNTGLDSAAIALHRIPDGILLLRGLIRTILVLIVDLVARHFQKFRENGKGTLPWSWWTGTACTLTLSLCGGFGDGRGEIQAGDLGDADASADCDGHAHGVGGAYVQRAA